jgi:hypothetical protein
MDERLKKRIFLFYTAGVVNLIMAGAVLLFGRGVVPEDKINLIFLFFMGFAALDFWMPQMMKKKWQDEQAKLSAQGSAANSQPPGKT